MVLGLLSLTGAFFTGSGLCVFGYVGERDKNKQLATHLRSTIKPLAVAFSEINIEPQIIKHTTTVPNWILYLRSCKVLEVVEPAVIQSDSVTAVGFIKKRYDISETEFGNELIDKSFGTNDVLVPVCNGFPVWSKLLFSNMTQHPISGNGTMVSHYLKSICSVTRHLHETTEYTGMLREIPACDVYLYGRKTFGNKFEYMYAGNNPDSVIRQVVYDQSNCGVYIVGALMCGVGAFVSLTSVFQ